MTEPQCIIHDYMPAVKKNMWWFPHGKHVYDGMKSLLATLYEGSTGRAAGVRGLLSLVPRTFKRDR